MTDQPQSAKLVQAETYQTHMVPSLFAPWAPVLLARATPRPGDRVLDVATGTGAVARQVAPLVGATGRVVGLDPNPAMLRVAGDLPGPDGAAVEWVVGDGQDLPFADGSFDLVLCQQGLQFFPDRALGLREMRRVLAPGGRAGIAVWQSIERQSLYHALDRAMERQGSGARMLVPFALGDPDELLRLLQGAGFSEAAVEIVPGETRFPSTEGWVALSIRGAAAVVPGLSSLDEAGLRALIAEIQAEMEEAIRPYADGDGIVIPMVTSVGTGQV